MIAALPCLLLAGGAASAQSAGSATAPACMVFATQKVLVAPIPSHLRGAISDSGRLIQADNSDRSEIYDVETGSRTLLPEDFLEDIRYSANDRFVASKKAVYDLKQGGKKLFEVPGNSGRVLAYSFTANSSKVRYALASGKVLEVELPSGKVREKRAAPNTWFSKDDTSRYSEVKFSEDGSKVIYQSGWLKYPVYVADLDTGKRHERKRGESEYGGVLTDLENLGFIGDGNEVVQRVGGKEFEILNVKTGKRTKFEANSLRGDTVQISSDATGRRILLKGRAVAAVFDRDTGRVIERRAPFYATEIVLSPDGRRWLEKEGPQVSLFDLGTQSFTPLGADEHNSRLHSKGRYVFYKTEAGKGVIYDLLTERTIPFDSMSGRPSWVGENKYAVSSEGLTQIVGLDSVCVDPNRKLAAPGCCGVPAQEPGTQQAVAMISEELVAQLCKAPYKAEDWKPWTRLPEGPEAAQQPIPREPARTLLMELQKPGAFVPERHLPVLMAALRSDLPRTEPDLILGCVDTLAVTHPKVFGQLLSLYPYLLQLKGTGKPACRTPEEEATLLAELTKRVYSRAEVQRGGSAFASWADLGPLRPLLTNLKPAQKKELIAGIAQSLLAQAAQSGDYRAAPGEELKQVIEASVAPLFGEKRRPVSHLFLSKGPDGEFNVPLAAGSVPIDGKAETLTPYGFYAKHFKPIPISKPDELGEGVEVSWTQAGQTFVGEIGVKVKGPRELAPADPAPKYKELWRDGKLSGILLFDRQDDAEGGYLAYLQQQGFRFGEPVTIQTPLEYVGEAISSGRIDYVVSAQGSGWGTIGRVRSPSRILKGTRTLADGREEVVELVMKSSAQWHSSLVIDDEKVQGWVAVRELNGGGQLVRFGPGQLEGGNVGSRLRTVKSPTFVDIPFDGTAAALGSMYEGDPFWTVLTKFREGKTYSEIRAAVEEALPEVLREDGGFRFPDEPAYERFRQGLQQVRVQKPKVEAVTDAP